MAANTNDTADFANKLYSIRPFKQVESPPSSGQKPNHSRSLTQPELNSLSAHSSGFHPYDSTFLPDFTGDASLIRNLSSTIDALFAKIQKIKCQFELPVSEACVPFSQKMPQQSPEKENELKGGSRCLKQRKLGSNQKRILMEMNTNEIVGKQKDTKYFDLGVKLINTKQGSAERINLISNSEKQKRVYGRGISIRDFELGRCVGSGKFGDVMMCRHKKTGMLFAIKKILKSTIEGYRMQEQFENELRIHRSLEHPNIVQLYCNFEDEYHVFLLMEYANDGTLMNHLRRSEQFTSQVLDQMLNAVDFLRRNHIAHRDIKPENIVLTMGTTAKLCDFGWASIFENPMRKTFCGTLDYVSPEMKDVGEYTMNVDLWSLGVLTFELLTGFTPHKKEITHWKLCGGKRQTKWRWDVLYPPEIGDIARSFIEDLLRENPDERASILACKSSFFIKTFAQVEGLNLQEEIALVFS